MANDTVHIQRLPPAGGIELVKARHVQVTVPRHVHTSYCIGLIEAGGRRSFMRGEQTVIPAGYMVVINPGEVHTCAPADDSGQSYRMFSIPAAYMAELAQELFGARRNVLFFPATAINDRLLFADLQRFAREINNPLPVLEIETSLLNLLARLVLRHAQAQLVLSAPEVNQQAITRARDFIDAYYDQEIKVDDLARVACLSAYHLVRLFTKGVGIPPHVYQTLVRLRQARQLLRQDVTIAETAAQTGFFDQSHFTNTFKKYVGVTPGKFIAMCRD